MFSSSRGGGFLQRWYNIFFFGFRRMDGGQQGSLGSGRRGSCGLNFTSTVGQEANTPNFGGNVHQPNRMSRVNPVSRLASSSTFLVPIQGLSNSRWQMSALAQMASLPGSDESINFRHSSGIKNGHGGSRSTSIGTHGTKDTSQTDTTNHLGIGTGGGILGFNRYSLALVGCAGRLNHHHFQQVTSHEAMKRI